MKIDKRKFELLRAKKVMSIKDLSEAAGVSSATICNYTDDVNPVSLGKIARALNVEPEDIIVDEEV